MFNRIASLFALVAALLPVQAAAQGIDETINTIFNVIINIREYFFHSSKVYLFSTFSFTINITIPIYSTSNVFYTFGFLTI